ncbi:hypothetical protein [Herbaspirillum sp. NPDC101397]|uniref:hypothetical protein n=1 Tax=Herbaspirillum sp. NPDC101397 TaxID=3364006 RepID=UPI00383B5EFB
MNGTLGKSFGWLTSEIQNWLAAGGIILFAYRQIDAVATQARQRKDKPGVPVRDFSKTTTRWTVQRCWLAAILIDNRYYLN